MTPTVSPGATIYPVTRPCPDCGGQLATDGRQEWCLACTYGHDDAALARQRARACSWCDGDGSPCACCDDGKETP